MDLPEPPTDLRESGAEFWRETQAAYVLDARDRPALLEACRSMDEIDLLRATIARDGVLGTGASGQQVEHPAMQGLRSHRVVLDKMLTRLALPDAHGKAPMTVAQRHAKTAADARWTDHRANRAAGTDG